MARALSLIAAVTGSCALAFVTTPAPASAGALKGAVIGAGVGALVGGKKAARNGALAVSLNNRGIDFLQMNLTDQEVSEIQSQFADQIGDACADDADRLMAGIVDEVTAELVQFY